MPGGVAVLSGLNGTLASVGTLNGTVMLGNRPYSGVYEVTPSLETQVLNTAGSLLDQNITVNPIPSNYGLITWDGSVLTVS